MNFITKKFNNSTQPVSEWERQYSYSWPNVCLYIVVCLLKHKAGILDLLFSEYFRSEVWQRTKSEMWCNWMVNHWSLSSINWWLIEWMIEWVSSRLLSAGVSFLIQCNAILIISNMVTIAATDCLNQKLFGTKSTFQERRNIPDWKSKSYHEII